MINYLCFYCNYQTTTESDLLSHLPDCAKAICLDCGQIQSPLGGKQTNIVRMSRKGGQVTLGAMMHPTCGQGSVLYKLSNDPRLG
jgi:hypothetical protein